MSPLEISDNSSACEPPYFGVFDLFKIGIGPSSSHSVGPMRAAASFVSGLKDSGQLNRAARIEVELFGSLALTGKGHQTDVAVLMGLCGELPNTIDTDSVPRKLEDIRSSESLPLAKEITIPFIEDRDLTFNRRTFLDGHPNALTFRAFAAGDKALIESTYYSIGGGFIIQEGVPPVTESESEVPFAFCSAKEVLEICQQQGFSISELARCNELSRIEQDEFSNRIQAIWHTMKDCVERGCRNTGILPGGLNIERRAPELYEKLRNRDELAERDPMAILDWVDLYALAVNEENAAGGRVVTAPTNGAAGIIPAVLHYYDRFCHSSSPEKIEQFLLTAAVIGSLYKRNASISGAEVGCQGEVGVACSMAAGALTEVLGGTPQQVEEAAEIGMEHNLGLTCDPIKGLVQIPCIERNAMGAVKAINASRMALRGDGHHFVSLDRIIRVMKRTGADMSSRYKETSQGGLAINLSEC